MDCRGFVNGTALYLLSSLLPYDSSGDLLPMAVALFKLTFGGYIFGWLLLFGNAGFLFLSSILLIPDALYWLKSSFS